MSLGSKYNIQFSEYFNSEEMYIAKRSPVVLYIKYLNQRTQYI